MSSEGTQQEPSVPEKKPPRRKPPKTADSALPGLHVKTRTETESSPAESSEERVSRLRREEAREAHEIFKERAVLVTSLAVVAVIVLASLGILILTEKSTLLNWATASLSAIMAGCLGYAVGKQDSDDRGK